MDFETLVRAKNELEPRVQQLVAHLDPERKALELEQIEERTTAPGFWDDPDAAKPLLQKRGAITNDIALAKRLSGGIEDLETGLELAKEDGDQTPETVAQHHLGTDWQGRHGDTIHHSGRRTGALGVMASLLPQE